MSSVRNSGLDSFPNSLKDTFEKKRNPRKKYFFRIFEIFSRIQQVSFSKLFHGIFLMKFFDETAKISSEIPTMFSTVPSDISPGIPSEVRARIASDILPEILKKIQK